MLAQYVAMFTTNETNKRTPIDTQAMPGTLSGICQLQTETCRKWSDGPRAVEWPDIFVVDVLKAASRFLNLR